MNDTAKPSMKNALERLSDDEKSSLMTVMFIHLLIYVATLISLLFGGFALVAAAFVLIGALESKLPFQTKLLGDVAFIALCVYLYFNGAQAQAVILGVFGYLSTFSLMSRLYGNPFHQQISYLHGRTVEQHYLATIEG